MQIIDYIRLVRKWVWLFVLLGLVTGGASYLVRSQQPPVYEAQVMLSVGSYFQSPNPDTAEIRTSVELARNYAVLATTYTVLQAVLDTSDYPFTYRQLSDMISARLISDTSLLVLTVTYTDPIQAASIANELAQQLILHSPTNPTEAQLGQIAMLTAEIETLSAELEEARDQRRANKAQLDAATSSGETQRLLAQRGTITDEINQISSNLAQYSATLADLQDRTNLLSIVEPAQIPTEPVGLGKTIVTALGFSVGIALAGITVWLIEVWGDAIETSEQATQTLGYSVLATITRFGRSGDQYPDGLITLHNPHSPIAEQYRTLRTNLIFSSGNHGKKAFIITSPGPAEGKSITTANLAIALADAGLRVLLIDADLRRPRLHEIFGAPNESGLTRLSCTSPDRIRVHGHDWDQLAISLTPELDPQSLGEGSSDGTCFECLQHTGIPGLRLITSGATPPKPADILGSSRMKQWFNAFMSAENIDVILFDTPPTLTVPDCAILASVTGASVIVVLKAGTSRRYAVQVRQRLSQLNVNVEGIVLNLVKPADVGRKYYTYQ